jgi:hypothetical protein
MDFFTICLITAGVYLATRRWFWFVAFAFGSLASFFAMCASVIHFQILGAVGFFILMFVCWSMALGVAE